MNKMSSTKESKELKRFFITKRLSGMLEIVCSHSGLSQQTIFIIALERFVTEWTKLETDRLEVEKQLKKLLGELDYG